MAETKENPVEDATGENDSKSKRPKPSKLLPTDRIAIPRQLEILRAFGASSAGGTKPVTNQMVAPLVKMSHFTVQLSNGFMVENGFLTRTEGGFKPAQEVVAFFHAFQFHPETAAQKLAPLMANTWFAETLMPPLSFGPHEEGEALGMLATAVNAAPDFKPQLVMLIDLMEASGLIVREGGMLRASKPGVQRQENLDTPDGGAVQPRKETPKGNVETGFSSLKEGIVAFNISVQVNMDELSTWRPDRIAAFFQGVAMVLSAKNNLEKESTN